MSLPSEVLADILSRLPAKTLLRLKIVCKLWYDLIKDPKFIKLHLQRSLATRSNFHFVFTTPLLHSADFDTFDNPFELNHPYKSLDDGNGGVTIKGSCNGLLCVQTDGIRFHVLIYNPTTQTYKALPQLEGSFRYHPSNSAYDYGFGYDSVSDDYKCVRILQNLKVGMIPSCESQVMVYSLNDQVWRTTTLTTPPDIYYDGGNVCLNDTIHWACFQKGVVDILLPIVTFKLRDECFSTLPLPVFNRVTTDLAFSCLVVGILDGCLCLSVSYCNVIYVWVMKDYGVAGSWTLLYRLPNDYPFDDTRKPICYSKDFNRLFVNFNFGLCSEIAYIDLGTMHMTDVTIGDFNRWTNNVHLCVENLLMLEGRNDIVDKEQQQQSRMKCKKNKRRNTSNRKLQLSIGKKKV